MIVKIKTREQSFTELPQMLMYSTSRLFRMRDDRRETRPCSECYQMGCLTDLPVLVNKKGSLLPLLSWRDDQDVYYCALRFDIKQRD